MNTRPEPSATQHDSSRGILFCPRSASARRPGGASPAPVRWAEDFQSSTLALDIGAPVTWRYKGKDHALSFLYRTRPEPGLHLSSVVCCEVRYERVDAPKAQSSNAPTTPG